MGQHSPINPEQGFRILKASPPQDFPTRLRIKRPKSVQNRSHLPSDPLWDRGPCTASHASPAAASCMGLAFCVFSTPHTEWSVQK